MDNRINSVNRKMNNKLTFSFGLVYTNFIREVRLTLYFKSKEAVILKKELATQVNAYLANIGVSYIKLHNLHWNVVGSQFKAAHEYLETLYDALADVLDAIAELLKMNGEAPLASMKGYLSVATIPELESVELDVKSAMQTVLKDMESLRTQAFFPFVS